MSSRDFFEDGAKSAVRGAVERVEGQTSAELVVAVRRHAGGYAFADLAFGALAALAFLAFLIYSDKVYATAWIPVDVAVVFVLAALFSWRTPTLRRLFCSSRVRQANLHREACRIFHEQKLARTTGRNAVFVLVGMFERKAAVVYDLGIDEATAGPAFAQAVRRIETSVDGLFPKLETFVAALDALGPALAPSMPKQDDDVNELPDDMGVA